MTSSSSGTEGEELVRDALKFHAEALERLLTFVHDELGERSPAFFARICDDALVESLLCLHGLHPLPVEERVREAVEGVRPYLKSHAGDVSIQKIENDVVYVKLQGTCDGCPSSALTAQRTVERAILQRVPEIREVRTESTEAGRDGKAIDLTVLALGG